MNNIVIDFESSPLTAHEQARLLAPINSFLKCATPAAWLEHACDPEVLPMILIDHLHCELKAAQSAVLLLRRYALDEASGERLLVWLKPYEDYVYRGMGDANFVERKSSLTKSLTMIDDQPIRKILADKMVRLIREELHHFEQVLAFLQQRGIPLKKLTAARYAASLLREVRTYEPEAMIDKLIVGAYIEARSCERFAALAPLLHQQGETELSQFYVSLLRSEARHYQDYLRLAEQLAQAEGITVNEERIQRFGELEAQLIQQLDPNFRFHSGVPTAT